jgi:hypothetical protein
MPAGAVDGFTDETGAPSRFSVFCRGTHIGDVFFHEATPGASGLAGAPLGHPHARWTPPARSMDKP